MRRGVYPGSFDPLTVAHLAIAEAAVEQCGLDRLDCAVARLALGKEHGHVASLEERVWALERARANRPWLGVVVTEGQLVADIAEGYDVVVMGADKWAQLHDPAFYGGSDQAMDAALARLPEVVVAPRPPWPPPLADQALRLAAPLAEVSSTAVRDGRTEWRAPEAG